MVLVRTKHGNDVEIGEMLWHCGLWRRVVRKRKYRGYPDALIVSLQLLDDETIPGEIVISATAMRDVWVNEDAPQLQLRDVQVAVG